MHLAKYRVRGFPFCWGEKTPGRQADRTAAKGTEYIHGLMWLTVSCTARRTEARRAVRSIYSSHLKARRSQLLGGLEMRGDGGDEALEIGKTYLESCG